MADWFPMPEPTHETIGVPQPAILTLLDAGRFHGEVLDVGCGPGALTIHVAERGYSAVGLDLSGSAIDVARGEAHRRGLRGAQFYVADATAFTGFDGRFGTVIDSALFHTLPPSCRAGYQAAIVRAAAPGASYFVLAFDRGGMPDGVPVSAVTAEELHDVVAAHWAVDDVRPALIHGGQMPDVAHAVAPPVADVEGGCSSRPVVISSDRPFPAWLLAAHLE